MISFHFELHFMRRSSNIYAKVFKHVCKGRPTVERTAGVLGDSGGILGRFWGDSGGILGGLWGDTGGIAIRPCSKGYTMHVPFWRLHFFKALPCFLIG